MQVASLFSWRRAGDVWSHIVQMGPLSLVPVVLLVLVLGLPQRLRGARGVFLLLAALGCYGPALLTGEGNLGAARNWDLFAGPSLAVAFAGLLLLLETEGLAVRQRLLLAALAASLAQAGAWTALGMNAEATRARVASLPLGRGRGAAMLGTDDMNAGRDVAALQWFERAIAEDSLNVNDWSGLGVVLARNGRYAEAEPALRRVVYLKPAVTIYRQDLAVLYMREQRWAEAAGQWQSALFVDHTLTQAWLGLAEAMRQQDADSAVCADANARGGPVMRRRPRARRRLRVLGRECGPARRRGGVRARVGGIHLEVPGRRPRPGVASAGGSDARARQGRIALMQRKLSA